MSSSAGLIPAGTGAGMNRMRIAATSRDAALRAQQRKLQEALIAPETAAEEHAAELAQGPEAAIHGDPLAEVAPSGNGTRCRRGRISERLIVSPESKKKAPPASLPAGLFPSIVVA